MLVAKFAILFELDLVRSLPLILGRCIIFSLALCTGKSNKYSIHYKPLDIYSTLSYNYSTQMDGTLCSHTVCLDIMT